MIRVSSVSLSPTTMPVRIASWVETGKQKLLTSLSLSQMKPKVMIETSLIMGLLLVMFEHIFSTIPSHSFLGSSMKQIADTI